MLPSQASPSIKEYLHKITEIDLVFKHLDLASNLQRYDGDPESNSTPRKYLQFVLDLSETGTLKSLVVALIEVITGHRNYVQVDI